MKLLYAIKVNNQQGPQWCRKSASNIIAKLCLNLSPPSPSWTNLFLMASCSLVQGKPNNVYITGYTSAAWALVLCSLIAFLEKATCRHRECAKKTRFPMIYSNDTWKKTDTFLLNSVCIKHTLELTMLLAVQANCSSYYHASSIRSTGKFWCP